MTRFSPAWKRPAWALPILAAALLSSMLVAQTGTPNIQVLDNTTVIALKGSVSYSPTTSAGVPLAKTFTVRNTGTANLLVSEAISVPAGFTLMASFPGVPNALLPGNVPAFTLAPGTSATFTVALNAPFASSYTGAVSIQTNVTGANPFTFNITFGRVVPPPAVRYIDDEDARFVASAGWTEDYFEVGTSGKVPYQRSLTWANPGTGTETATWTFSGLEPGQYRVSATWVGYEWAATNAPHTVLDGTTALATLRVNQTTDSAGFSDGGAVWQDLGTFTITGTTLAIRISDDADNFVTADAIRIERIGYPGGLLDDAGAGFTTTGTWRAGYTQPGAKNYQGTATRADATSTPGTATATATWTFTVPPGQYRVMCGFQGYKGAASNAPFSVYDNNTLRTTVGVDQRSNPTDLTDAGVGWRHLGVLPVNSTTIRVVLTNNANGRVYADAIRVERANVPTVLSEADTVRLLQQATWGPTPALITQVRNQGFNSWLNGQFDPLVATPTSYPTMPLYSGNDNLALNNIYSCYGDPAVAGNPARSACLRDNYSMYPLQNRFFTNALYGDDQLRQRVAWSLHKIWVISGVDIRQPSWVAPYLQILSDEAFGNYRTLMYRITLNPGMGNYLDMAGSSRVQPNENYPRELMQLFTIGLDELNPDGSRKLSGGAPIPTYDQALVESVTKVYTGWNFAPNLLETGTSSGSNTTTTFNDTSKNWSTNRWAGLSLRINTGAGSGQTRTIASNTSNQLTLTTAWTTIPNATSTYQITGVTNYIDPMRLGGAATENPANHDFTQKTLLRGFIQPARTSSVANAYLDLNESLDNIYNHPNLAPFVCKQLIQSLVTSNPTPGYVARVVDVFNRNRTSATQMREVVRAIILDPEARGDRKIADNYGHLKEPVLYVNNLMRMFDAKSANRTVNSDGYLNPDVTNLGQDTFRPPSVFSYYSPFKIAVGGVPPVIGPEYQTLTTSTALRRINFINQAFAPNSTRTIDAVRNPGTTPSGVYPPGHPLAGQPLVPTGPLGTAVDVSSLASLASNPAALADRLNVLMLHGTMTAEMKAEIVTAVNAVAATNPNKRVRTAVYLVSSSSQYQVQR